MNSVQTVIKRCKPYAKPRPMPLNHPDYVDDDTDPLIDGFKYPKMLGQKRQRNKRMNYDASIPFIYMFLEDFYVRNGIEMDEVLNAYGEPTDISTEIKILEISPSGHGGIGILHDQAVLVPFTQTGDLVKVNVFRDCQMFYKGKVLEIVKPSENRVDPPCKYFGTCGGCQLQYLSYEEQLRQKHFHIADAYSRLETSITVSKPIRSPREYAYRTKLTPHYDKPRNLEMKDVPIGFNHHDSRKVLDIEECVLVSSKMNSKLKELRFEIQNIVEPPKQGSTLLIREGTNDFWTLDNYDDKSYVVDDPKSHLTVNVNNIVFSLSSNSFFQNNSLILPEFVNFIKSQINTDYLVDAYCGVGLFALTCADSVKQVVGVEVARVFVDNAVQNAIDNNIMNCKFVEGQAEFIFKSVTFDPGNTTIIMDPPRKGSSKAFLDQLMDFKPKTIIYVACGLYAQVRDIRYLMNGIWHDFVSTFEKDFRIERPKYSISCIQPVDLFPQTSHIESIVILRLEESESK
eukprot:NODE_198_length_15297_cov_0.486182.p3 type:complete len:514 gc:universal NODE_198_length_15297_cov_0.486182:10739-12280(+)